MLKKTAFLIAVVSLIFYAQGPLSRAEVVDKILVIVNDEIITQGDVDRILVPIYEQYKELYSQEELMAKLEEARKSILAKLIDDKLMLSEAKKRGVEIDKSEIEAKLAELRSRFRSEEEFRQAMERENLVLSELEKRYRERLMVEKLIESEARRQVSVSPNEVFLYYQQHGDEFREPKRVKLRAILIRIGPERSEEEALRLAKEILQRLWEGGDFSLLAAKYSDGPYAKSGGDMSWVKEGELMEKINGLVFEMEKNQLSGILETNLGYHIFKVEDKAPARKLEFSEVKDRIEAKLYNEKVQENLSKWAKELRENAYIAFR